MTTALKTGKKQPMASERTNKIVPRMQIESVSGETTVHTKRGQKEAIERDTRQEEEEIEENEVVSEKQEGRVVGSGPAQKESC